MTETLSEALRYCDDAPWVFHARYEPARMHGHGQVQEQTPEAHRHPWHKVGHRQEKYPSKAAQLIRRLEAITVVSHPWQVDSVYKLTVRKA